MKNTATKKEIKNKLTQYRGGMTAKQKANFYLNEKRFKGMDPERMKIIFNKCFNSCTPETQRRINLAIKEIIESNA